MVGRGPFDGRAMAPTCPPHADSQLTRSLLLLQRHDRPFFASSLLSSPLPPLDNHGVVNTGCQDRRHGRFFARGRGVDTFLLALPRLNAMITAADHYRCVDMFTHREQREAALVTFQADFQVPPGPEDTHPSAHTLHAIFVKLQKRHNKCYPELQQAKAAELATAEQEKAAAVEVVRCTEVIRLRASLEQQAKALAETSRQLFELQSQCCARTPNDRDECVKCAPASEHLGAALVNLDQYLVRQPCLPDLVAAQAAAKAATEAARTARSLHHEMHWKMHSRGISPKVLDRAQRYDRLATMFEAGQAVWPRQRMLEHTPVKTNKERYTVRFAEGVPADNDNIPALLYDFYIHERPGVPGTQADKQALFDDIRRYSTIAVLPAGGGIIDSEARASLLHHLSASDYDLYVSAVIFWLQTREVRAGYRQVTLCVDGAQSRQALLPLDSVVAARSLNDSLDYYVRWYQRVAMVPNLLSRRTRKVIAANAELAAEKKKKAAAEKKGTTTERKRASEEDVPDAKRRIADPTTTGCKREFDDNLPTAKRRTVSFA